MSSPRGPHLGLAGLRRWLVSFARFALGIAILGALLWWLGPDWHEFEQALEFHPGYWLLSFVGTVAAVGFTAARWQLLNERMTATRLPFSVYFHSIALTRFIGQFTSMMLMDFVGRGAGLRAAGSRQNLGHLLTPVLLERLLDLLLPAVLLAWAIAVHQTAVGDAPWLTLALLLTVFAIGVVPLIQPIARLAVALYLRLKRWRGAPVDAHEVQVATSTAAYISGYSLLRYASALLQFFGTGAAAGVMFEPDVLLSAFSASQLSAILAITPGGLGIQEVGWVGAFRWLAQEETAIAVFVVAARVLQAFNFGVLSLFTYLLFGRQRPGASTVSEHNAAP